MIEYLIVILVMAKLPVANPIFALTLAGTVQTYLGWKKDH
jgi:hypothetical protein